MPCPSSRDRLRHDVDVVDHVEKLLYCLKMMGLAAAVAERPGEDYRKRVFGRMVIVYLGAFLEPALELKNKRGLKGSEAEKLLVDLKVSYEDYYVRIRHTLSAHRQDQPYAEMCDAWNAIDWTTTALLAGDAQTAWAALQSADGSLPNFAAAPAVAKSALLDRLVAARTDDSEGSTFSLDNLSMTRGQMGIVPGHRVQVRGSEIVSILDCLEASNEALLELPTDFDSDLVRLIVSMMVLDLCNLVDCLYGVAGGRSKAPADSFLDILEEDAFDGAPVLRAAADGLDMDAVTKIRAVRNTIVAHLDRDRPLSELLFSTALEGDDVNAVFSPARHTFFAACAADLSTRIFLIHGSTMEGLHVIPDNEVQKPYDI